VCNPITTAHPERLLAKGEHMGFEWEVTNNRRAYRCGYVRVPAGHPWHGREYDDLDVYVHGGLTFSAPDADCGRGGGDNAWWVGFDCGHAGDAPDPELDGFSGSMIFPGDTVRSQRYVEAECRLLCAQAWDAAHTVGAAEDADRPVHMCGEFDCDCPTTEEFEDVLRRLEREHHENARLIVAQLTNAALKEAKRDS